MPLAGVFFKYFPNLSGGKLPSKSVYLYKLLFGIEDDLKKEIFDSKHRIAILEAHLVFVQEVRASVFKDVCKICQGTGEIITYLGKDDFKKECCSSCEGRGEELLAAMFSKVAKDRDVP